MTLLEIGILIDLKCKPLSKSTIVDKSNVHEEVVQTFKRQGMIYEYENVCDERKIYLGLTPRGEFFIEMLQGLNLPEFKYPEG